MSERSLWTRINERLARFRLFFGNLVFIVMLILVAVILFGGRERIDVPDGGALVIDPQGSLVERRTIVDPFREWLTPGATLAETEVGAVLEALQKAAQDDRIALVVLHLDDLQFASTAHAEAVAEALKAFRAAGKEVIAYGTFYDQPHYLMASAADAVYLHPFGQLILPGYQVQSLYFKDLLDKLKIKINIFRVGRYKEFVEPFDRMDMSDAAREANRQMVDTLWARYADLITANRDLDPERFRRYAQQFDEALAETDGDMARLAVEYQLVDELLTPDEARVRVADKVGYAEHGKFRQIAMADYLTVAGDRDEQSAARRVGVIIAEGTIVAGDAQGGVIAADRLIKLIRRAREDDSVATLVLRLNTPGGSAFASELIRQELELTQLAGKPVVVSMGPVAASGGYWIASTADAILAEPTSITGSIGVFGIVPSFEDSLATIGVANDGVTTSELATASPLTGVNEATARVLQASVEHTYERFVNLVARGRDLSPEQVEQVAQGRIWVGSRALELGLVDALGGSDDAVARAAELAQLEEYRIKRIEPPLSPRELLLRELLGGAAAQPAATIRPLIGALHRASALLETLDDPRNLYALCGSCALESGGW